MPRTDRLRPNGDTVLARLLLAIIEAHTTLETERYRQQRLDAALTALLGLVTPTEQELSRALRFMARERQRDACDVEMAALASSCPATAKSVRSIPQLAEVAAREVMGCVAPKEIQTIARHLCDLYRAHGNAHAVARDPTTDALEAEAVERLCAELAEWGVPTRL
jgi:hypothetical protein